MTEWFKEHKAISIILGVLIITALAMIIFGEPRSRETAAISGSVNFNGIGPQDGSRNGNIILMQRELGQSDFVSTNATIPIADGAAWTWTEAESGITYDLKADVFYNGQFIKSSNIVTTTAPAAGQVLTFNITLSDIPDFIIQENTTSISGSILIDGFVPTDATVSIFAAGAGLQGMEEVLANIPARTTTSYQWNGALTGQEYQLEARLVNANGTVIGASQRQNIVAPAKSEDIKLSSQASSVQEQETKTASISGMVRISGPVVQGSTLLMLQREVGETNFTAFDRLPATSNAAWTLRNLAAGQRLEITSALQVNEQNVATGEVLTLSAPATNQVINLDTGFNLPAPNSRPRISCGAMDSTGHFNAELVFPSVNDARKYYVQVGTTAGGRDLLNQGFDAPNGDLTTTVFIARDTNYFTRYAYSLCADCNIQDRQNWSGWSPTLGFRCPQ